jgi:NADH dehydrogenase
MKQTKKTHIFIIGGGFTGIQSAKRLLKHKKSHNLEITLVDKKSYFEYYPGLYRTVTDRAPRGVAIPYTTIFSEKEVAMIQDTIVGVSKREHDYHITGSSGITYTADYVILAPGSETTYFNIQGLENCSFSFKSLAQATVLQDHIIDLFQKNAHADKEEKVVALHFIIVGGGASGVELAGEMAEYTKKLAPLYNIDPSFVTIDLIEGASRLVPMLPEKTSRIIQRRLALLGVNVFLNRTLVKGSSWTVYLNDMKLGAKTVIWTAGVIPNKLLDSIDGLQKNERGRAIVDDYLRAQGFETLFVGGDSTNTPYAGMAQTALYDADHIAHNILRHTQNKPMRAYKPKSTASNIPIGKHWAVFTWHSYTFSGLLASMMRRIIDAKFFFSVLPFSLALRASRIGTAFAAHKEPSQKESNML